MEAMLALRAMALGFAMHLAINAIISYGIAAYFFEREFWFGFLLSLVVLVVLPPIFKFRDALITALFLYLRFNKIVATFDADLRKSGIPSSGDYGYFDADLFLEQVQNDENLPAKARIGAGATLSSLQVLRTTGMVRALFASSALERAIREHWKYDRNSVTDE